MSSSLNHTRTTRSLRSNQNNRKVTWVITVLLLVSLACSLPSFGGEPTPSQPATAVSEPTRPAQNAPAQTSTAPQPAVDLPPALVETQPLPGSVLPTSAAPVLYFNQPMERASVESAITVSPEQPVRLEWIDDATVRVQPEQPLESDAGLQISVDTRARAANGQAIAGVVEIQYQSPGDLRIAERIPAPDTREVNPASTVAVTFTQPVVALGADPAALPAGFIISGPDGAAPAGRGAWLNTSTYIFYPQPALLGGAAYTVQVNPALVSTSGAALLPEDAAAAWGFTTAPPQLVSITPGTEQPVPLDAEFALTFNQPMNRASVEENFVLARADGTAVQGTFTWNEDSTVMRFLPSSLLERGGAFNIFVSGQAQSQGGAALGSDFAASIATVGQFAVSSTSPAAGEALEVYFSYATIEVYFLSPVAPGQDYRSLVQISPEVGGLSVTRSFDGSQLYLSGYFKPGTSYTLQILPELQDRWGASLETPYTLTFSTLPAQPYIALPPVVFVPQGETYLPVRSVNIDQVVLSRGALTVAEFIAAQESWTGIENWQSKVQAEWARPLSPTPNTVQTVDIPLHPNNEPLAPGLYFLHAAAPQVDSGANPTRVVVSPIHLTLKTSLRQAFVWAVRTADQEPAGGLAVAIYDGNAQQVASCTTDEIGVCQADIPPVDAFEASYYAVVGQPGDPSFSLGYDNWMEGVSPWVFGIGYQRSSVAPEVYLYTDRPIYRPGQTVHFRAVVRGEDNGRYTPPQMQSITVEIISTYDPVTSQSPVLATMTLPLDAYGTAVGSFDLAGDARPGLYTLRVREARYQDLYFTVAEYRKPEIDVQVNFAAADQLFGEDLQANISAQYFFGAPASSVSVRWTLYAALSSPALPDGLFAGRLDTGWLSIDGPQAFTELYITEGQGQTEADGTLAVTIPGALIRDRLEAQSGQTLRFRLEATVQDESNLGVSARTQMTVHPSRVYAGARAEQWVVSAGEEITYVVQSVDWQGQPVGDTPLRAVFSKVTWVQEDAPDLYAPPHFRMEASEVGSTEFRTSAAGDARLAFTPDQPGTYLLEITGEGGIITEALIWVGGEGAALWPDTPNQRLQLQTGATSYLPGQTAMIFIPNPFVDGALALVTVERGKVMRSQVIRIDDASYELELPLSSEDAPNVYVSVLLVGRSGGRPDFRAGYLELDVSPQEQVLQVTAQVEPQQAQPGDQAIIQLDVRDSSGAPVQGQFSLALVDKAVLALADPNSEPIVDALYGPQWLGVKSGYALSIYAGRELNQLAGRGGGGGSVQEVPTVRENFADTAYWNGTIETGVDGRAQISLTLPHNLTTWVADVRGLTGDTRVGQAEIELVTSKPLLIRPVTPRFVVVGDHIQLTAIVQNTTANPLDVSIRLEGSGVTFDDPIAAVQPVTVAAGGRVEVGWWGTVQDVEQLDLTFQADAGTLQDSARPELGAIPVLRYTVPETFATSGMLSEAGTQLELVSLPRSFSPTGGDLRVELTPSLTAAVYRGLQALDEFPYDFTEPVISRLLPNLVTLRALQEAQLEDATMRAALEAAIVDAVDRLVRLQNGDGGWSWAPGGTSDIYITSYAVLALSQSAQQGVFVDPEVIRRGHEYLLNPLDSADEAMEPWAANRLAFQLYVLEVTGVTGFDLEPLFTLREKLSPWGKAFLALAIEQQNAGDPRARTLLEELAASPTRTVSSASWQDDNPHWTTWSTSLSTTAIVAYALARLDPASPLLVDAVRYLVLNRQPSGAWNSSYESAWSLMAMIETVRGTGDLQADYTYSASLNGAQIASAEVHTPAQAVNPVTTITALETLLPDVPNALEFQRGEGGGRLYYRAYLNATRPVESAPAMERGITLTRQYYQTGADCRTAACQPVMETNLSDGQPLLVRLSLTVPNDMYYLVIEDHFPSGVELLNPRLNTSQQIMPELPEGEEAAPASDPLERLFTQGWGWWHFANPQQYDDSIRWVVDYLPAGTYELTYYVSPFLAGEYRLLPARAYQYYFPEIEGRTAGAIFSIR